MLVKMLRLPLALATTRAAIFEPFVWPSTPPVDAPFAPSAVFSSVEFAGEYAAYEGADTWYPSWARDGSMVTPWTDGGVQGASSDSGCAPDGCLSTTGFATVLGDDPRALNVSRVGTFASGPSPYRGRYPCGSLVYNGTWFYGTYLLDNENHEVGSNAAGYCENWCVQGPFVGFRTSTDLGETWDEPRVNMTSWSDNIFGEAAPDNHTKVKFGAPHVVDFGRELEHSPDGKLYIVGHGASSAYSPHSWMQGSEVYLARCAPTAAAVRDLGAWEFWTGDAWAAGAAGVAAARPIVSWANRTGVVTATWLPAVGRFLMAVSTPTFSPFTERAFDTYFLEAEALTGPWHMISYLGQFGPQSYFVNVPSKFVNATRADDGSLELWLSYSANFANNSLSRTNPPGSGYHWTLSKVRLHP